MLAERQAERLAANDIRIATMGIDCGAIFTLVERIKVSLAMYQWKCLDQDNKIRLIRESHLFACTEPYVSVKIRKNIEQWSLSRSVTNPRP